MEMHKLGNVKKKFLKLGKGNLNPVGTNVQCSGVNWGVPYMLGDREMNHVPCDTL